MPHAFSDYDRWKLRSPDDEADMLNPQMPPEEDETDECWNCGGMGQIAGCFEDCCSGADCDPEDPEYCCAPSRCDVCRGKGYFQREPSKSSSQSEPDPPSEIATDIPF